MYDTKKIINILFSVVYISFFTAYFYNITQQKPFSDDWMMLEIARELKGRPLADWLLVKDHFSQWRPLPFILKGLYLNGGTPDLTAYNFFKLIIFITIVALTYGTAKLILDDRKTALLASILFLANPTNVGSVQNIDHIFKLTGTLFFALSVILLYLAVTQRRLLCFCGFLLAYLAGFLSDADAVAIFPAAMLILVYHNQQISRGYAASVALISLAILLAYLVLRACIVGGGVTAGGVPGQQDILIGPTTLVNGLKMLASVLIFTASPYVVLKKPVFLALGAFFLVVNAVAVAAAIMLSPAEDRKKLLLLLGLSCVATVPFALLRHVSEIYTIKAAYLLMAALAFSFRILRRRLRSGAQRALTAYLVVMSLSGMHALWVKQGMMLERGKMAEGMAASMRQALPAPPPYATIDLIVDPCGIDKTYSDFINDDYLLAQLDKRYDYFIRYNYSDSTLNRHQGQVPDNTYTLKWSCKEKKFTIE